MVLRLGSLLAPSEAPIGELPAQAHQRILAFAALHVGRQVGRYLRLAHAHEDLKVLFLEPGGERACASLHQARPRRFEGRALGGEAVALLRRRRGLPQLAQEIRVRRRVEEAREQAVEVRARFILRRHLRHELHGDRLGHLR